MWDDDDELRQLREGYAAELPGKATAIAQAAAALSGGVWDPASAQALGRLAHDLAGSAGSYGFPSVSEAARQIELTAKPLVGVPELPSGTELAVIDKQVAALLAVVDRVSVIRPPEAVPEPKGPSGRILLVDDDPNIRLLVGKLLGRRGYQVLTADDGEQGIHMASDEVPDLVLLDITMPGLDGYGTCHRLQNGRTTYHIPIVFLTAHSGDQDRAKAFAVGAADYLVKPVTEDALLETVRRNLARNRRWQGLQTEQSGAASIGTRLTYDVAKFKDYLVEQLPLTPQEANKVGHMAWDDVWVTASEIGLGGKELATLMAQFCHLAYLPAIDSGKVRLGVFPAAYCRANQVVALEGDTGATDFVLTNPFNLGLMEAILRDLASTAGTLYVTEPETLQPLLAYRPAEPTVSGLDADFVALEAQLKATYGITEAALPSDAAEKSAPIILLVNKLIEGAYEAGASDIHVEPQEDEIVIRYRIDGHLQVANRLKPQRLIHPLVARLKVMSGLDISEKRLPQDGRIVYKDFCRGRFDFDLRVATAPMAFGEKIVMRVIDKQKSVLPLETLGFAEDNLVRYRAKLQAPYGMVLHVGPTGSGKSMTLYAALNELRAPDVNIQTVEDPIEYTLPGINQLQIKPDIGLSFARALRSFLRQDPDVILVGEIRDRETAQIAVEAAMTGHLLFSTLHTNDAATTVTRFMEMGIEPYLISSTVLMVCAQRLLRRLCPDCKVSRPLTGEEVQFLGLDAVPDWPVCETGPGCDSCRGSGYKGRIGIHEVLVPDDALRAAIGQPGMTAGQLKRMAVERGMTTLFWDAMTKVRQGLCSLDDALGEVLPDEFDARPAQWRS